MPNSLGTPFAPIVRPRPSRASSDLPHPSNSASGKCRCHECSVHSRQALISLRGDDVNITFASRPRTTLDRHTRSQSTSSAFSWQVRPSRGGSSHDEDSGYVNGCGHEELIRTVRRDRVGRSPLPPPAPAPVRAHRKRLSLPQTSFAHHYPPAIRLVNSHPPARLSPILSQSSFPIPSQKPAQDQLPAAVSKPQLQRPASSASSAQNMRDAHPKVVAEMVQPARTPQPSIEHEHETESACPRSKRRPGLKLDLVSLFPRPGETNSQASIGMLSPEKFVHSPLPMSAIRSHLSISEGHESPKSVDLIGQVKESGYFFPETPPRRESRRSLERDVHSILLLDNPPKSKQTSRPRGGNESLAVDPSGSHKPRHFNRRSTIGGSSPAAEFCVSEFGHYKSRHLISTRQLPSEPLSDHEAEDADIDAVYRRSARKRRSQVRNGQLCCDRRDAKCRERPEYLSRSDPHADHHKARNESPRYSTSLRERPAGYDEREDQRVYDPVTTKPCRHTRIGHRRNDSAPHTLPAGYLWEYQGQFDHGEELRDFSTNRGPDHRACCAPHVYRNNHLFELPDSARKSRTKSASTRSRTRTREKEAEGGRKLMAVTEEEEQLLELMRARRAAISVDSDTSTDESKNYDRRRSQTPDLRRPESSFDLLLTKFNHLVRSKSVKPRSGRERSYGRKVSGSRRKARTSKKMTTPPPIPNRTSSITQEEERHVQTSSDQKRRERKKKDRVSSPISSEASGQPDPETEPGVFLATPPSESLDGSEQVRSLKKATAKHPLSSPKMGQDSGETKYMHEAPILVEAIEADPSTLDFDDTYVPGISPIKRPRESARSKRSTVTSQSSLLSKTESIPNTVGCTNNKYTLIPSSGWRPTTAPLPPIPVTKSRHTRQGSSPAASSRPTSKLGGGRQSSESKIVETIAEEEEEQHSQEQKQNQPSEQEERPVRRSRTKSAATYALSFIFPTRSKQGVEGGETSPRKQPGPGIFEKYVAVRPRSGTLGTEAGRSEAANPRMKMRRSRTAFFFNS